MLHVLWDNSERRQYSCDFANELQSLLGPLSAGWIRVGSALKLTPFTALLPCVSVVIYGDIHTDFSKLQHELQNNSEADVGSGSTFLAVSANTAENRFIDRALE